MKRVVITGLGILSSIGNNKNEVLESLKEGKSGIRFSQAMKDAGMRSQVCGDVKLDTTGLVDRKLARFMNDASIYGYLALKEAIEDAELTPEQISNPRTGLIAGYGGSTISQYKAVHGMINKGLKGVGPYAVTKSMASGISACLSTAFQIKGTSYSVTSACATSVHCIGHAMELIQLGKQDVVFAGGGEELCWEMSCEFDAMGALSTKYNDSPEKASRAYDANRDGFVIAGGAGMVVVEELEHALKRGAPIYGEIIGYAATSDGADMVAPSGEGAMRCMQLAVNEANRPIDYINTHGTSTPIGDVKELWAIKEVFGDKMPAISSTKSMTGHSLSAVGAQEIIYSLLMLENQFIAPSINIETLDEAAQGLNIVTKPTPKALETVMSNSFGFGGTNACMVLTKFKS